jgi:hypothetical protein
MNRNPQFSFEFTYWTYKYMWARRFLTWKS